MKKYKPAGTSSYSFCVSHLEWRRRPTGRNSRRYAWPSGQWGTQDIFWEKVSRVWTWSQRNTFLPVSWDLLTDSPSYTSTQFQRASHDIFSTLLHCILNSSISSDWRYLYLPLLSVSGLASHFSEYMVPGSLCAVWILWFQI